MNTHRYYCINRPPGYAQVPEGYSTFETWLPTQQVGTRDFYGWVEYPEPLPFQKVWQFELHPADPMTLNAYWEWREENEC